MGTGTYYTRQETGYTLNKHEYDAWGYNTKAATYNYDPEYRATEPYFTGHPYDGALNLYYAHNRFFDAQTGQWLSEDPIKSGLNWYQYCNSNPTSYVDVLGLSAKGYFSVMECDEEEESRGLGQMFGLLNCIFSTINGQELKNNVKLQIEKIKNTIYEKYHEPIAYNENVKKEILNLLEEEGVEQVERYLQTIRKTNPDVHTFLELLAMIESSGNYTAHREGSQYLGRYQIGDSTFKQIGFKDEEGNWTELAESLGVDSEQSFLNSKTAQEVAIIFAIRWDYQFLISNENLRYVGTKVEGIELTKSGLIAAEHLIGQNKLNSALRGEIPWSEAKDGFNTPALKYIEELGNLDLSSILGGIE